MKYKIRRSSTIGEKSCDEAFMSSCENWQIRTCTEKDFNKLFSDREGLWRDRGTEHRIDDDGNIVRRLENTDEWTVEINTLKELNDFSEKYGNLIISLDLNTKDFLIEIYDDYRE